jgi:hypothetical protein
MRPHRLFARVRQRLGKGGPLAVALSITLLVEAISSPAAAGLPADRGRAPIADRPAQGAQTGQQGAFMDLFFFIRYGKESAFYAAIDAGVTAHCCIRRTLCSIASARTFESHFKA